MQAEAGGWIQPSRHFATPRAFSREVGRVSLNSEYSARDMFCWHGDDLLARLLGIQDLGEESKATHYFLKKNCRGSFYIDG